MGRRSIGMAVCLRLDSMMHGHLPFVCLASHVRLALHGCWHAPKGQTGPSFNQHTFLTHSDSRCKGIPSLSLSVPVRTLRVNRFEANMVGVQRQEVTRGHWFGVKVRRVAHTWPMLCALHVNSAAAARRPSGHRRATKRIYPSPPFPRYPLCRRPNLEWPTTLAGHEAVG